MNLSDLKPSYYFFNGTFAFLSKSTDNDFHSHHAMQISIGLSNPFKLETDTGKGEYRAIIIDTDSIHKFDGMDKWHLILLIDPEHENVRHIKNNRLINQIAELPFDMLRPHAEDIVHLMTQNATCFEVKKSLDRLLFQITGSREKPRETDRRILKIFNYIENLDEKKVSMEELTALVNLSESRLSHMFKEQIGIPVRRYILWVRLVDAMRNAIEGHSLTAAAHNAGFSDSAHLTRTFRSMFGSIPSTYTKTTKNSSFNQFVNCFG